MIEWCWLPPRMILPALSLALAALWLLMKFSVRPRFFCQ